MDSHLDHVHMSLGGALEGPPEVVGGLSEGLAQGLDEGLDQGLDEGLDDASLQESLQESGDGQDHEGSEALEAPETSPFANVAQGLAPPHREWMLAYWQQLIDSIESDHYDFKSHALPLARIKRVMKCDEDVKMISAEAPILFAKACDVFITEITMRAWAHAEENKRRTLQRSDVQAAIQTSDIFDFLIDIIPRE